MNAPRPTVSLPVEPERVLDAVKDAAYVTIGFGVLAFQRAQVRRQELMKAAEQRVGSLDDRYREVEARLDEVIGVVGKRLPEPAAAVLEQAHRGAQGVRRRVASKVLSAA